MRPPRGVLFAGTSAPLKHSRAEPVAALSEIIEHFWRVDWDLRGLAPLNPQTLPHPSVHVVIEGSRHEITGVFTRRFSRVLEGKGRVFGIKFRPAMFQALLGKPVSTLANRVVPIAQVFGREGARFARAVQRAEDPTGLANAFFLERVTKPAPLAVAMRDLVERTASDRSLIKVEQLLDGVTARTLQRQFRHYVGVGPKWVLQRYRLHEVNERLKLDPHLDLADLAYELGYVDQPHFVRDFKALVGVTPGAYAKQIAKAQ